MGDIILLVEFGNRSFVGVTNSSQGLFPIVKAVPFLKITNPPRFVKTIV